MKTSAFWTATLERVVRTFAQALLAVLGAGTFGLMSAPWQDAVGTAGLAAVLALLTAVATSGGAEGPGLTETVNRRAR